MHEARSVQGSDDEGALRLAIIAMAFPEQSETFVSARVKSLAERGVQVEVHSLRPDSPHAEELAVARGIADVPRTHLSALSVARGLAVALTRPRLSLRYLQWLVGTTRAKPDTLLRSLVLSPRVFGVFADLTRRPPDVVHAEWGHYPALVVWLVQAGLPGVSTSIALNAYDLTMEYGPSVTVADQADLIRTHTRANVPHIVRFTGVAAERVKLIYNGVNVPAVDEAVARTEKVPGRVVTIARMIPEKRIDLVIRTFAACAPQAPHARLRVFGEGVERQRLESLVDELGLSDSVSFLGHVHHARMIEEIAQAEVVMLLSETVDERLPNVVKEGMAARCVTITTRSVGIEELVDHGVSGFVVDYGDLEGAQRALAWALSDSDAARAMGDVARAEVAKEFDHETNVSRFLDLWRGIARRPRVSGGS